MLVVGERLVELVISQRHIEQAKLQGGIERGLGHYPFMVLLHMSLLVGCVVEVWLRDPPVYALFGWSMVVVVIAAQGLRWWCITTLGPLWNTRIVVIPGVHLVRHGPYRWLRHPNYLAVVVEGLALPLVRNAWITAAVFGAANAWLLTVRIRAEDSALLELASPTSTTDRA